MEPPLGHDEPAAVWQTPATSVSPALQVAASVLICGSHTYSTGLPSPTLHVLVAGMMARLLQFQPGGKQPVAH